VNQVGVVWPYLTFSKKWRSATMLNLTRLKVTGANNAVLPPVFEALSTWEE